MITVIDKEVLSSDNIHQLKGKVYLPEGEARGLFHVVHGMAEFTGRYDGFMREMAEDGYIVFGYDHLGHGLTARDDSELGYFAHENGWKLLIDDVYVFGSAVRKEMGDGLPLILMGHSMGSFIARLTAAKYDYCDKLIIMGTGGPNPAANAGIAMTASIKALRGERYRSKFLYSIAFGSYNKYFKEDEDHYSWLSTLKSTRDAFRNNKFCTFMFTASAMQDLLQLTTRCNDAVWYTAINRKLPILLVSGAEDPVGDYGKGVMTVYDGLKAAGANVRMKLYPGVRHEILNDTSRDLVIEDIKQFLTQS